MTEIRAKEPSININKITEVKEKGPAKFTSWSCSYALETKFPPRAPCPEIFWVLFFQGERTEKEKRNFHSNPTGTEDKSTKQGLGCDDQASLGSGSTHVHPLWGKNAPHCLYFKKPTRHHTHHPGMLER
jgi:hypothetical protein